VLLPELGEVLLSGLLPGEALPPLLLLSCELDPELLPPMPREPPNAEPGCTPNVE